MAAKLDISLLTMTTNECYFHASCMTLNSLSFHIKASTETVTTAPGL